MKEKHYEEMVGVMEANEKKEGSGEMEGYDIIYEEVDLTKAAIAGSRGVRRKKDVTKALRKRRISNHYRTLGDTPYYTNLHQYSKNKIHCSCPLCAFNAKRHGRVIYPRMTVQDMRQAGRMKAQENEFRMEDVSIMEDMPFYY